WWQVPDYEASFNIVWRTYEQVSFFRADLLQMLKSRTLAKYGEAKVRLNAFQEAHDTLVIDMVDATSVYVPLEVTKEEERMKNDEKVYTQV
ncbi:hypothetical protein, partial [Escherichia coli]|uniref:hypothetical protein n=1 Tax=Escherichia coli TaxID=562 RepID=UPI001AD93088